MMAFVKDYWRSSLLGAFGALVLLCLGLPVYDRLTLDTPQGVPDTDTHNTAKPSPSGVVNNVPHVFTLQFKRLRTKTNTRQKPILKNVVPILPVHAHSAVPPLPLDIQTRLNQIYQEMISAGTMLRDPEW